jgi:AraC-like DNA-binding protein
MIGLNTFAIPPRTALRGHAHQRLLLMIVSEGGLEEELGRDVHYLRPGAARLSQAASHHELEFGADGARCTLIEADGPFWLRVFARALRGRANAFAVLEPDDASVLSQTDVTSLLRSDEALTRFGRALSTLQEGERREPPAWFADARAALDGADQRRVACIARSLRRDRTHFARAFANHSGFRPVEYRALRRLAAAMDALSGNAPLAEIALTSGYAHQSHMTNSFRAVLGASPARIRAM